MGIYLKTADEIELMRNAGRLAGATLREISKYIKPGVTTLQLDKIAEEFIRDNGAIPTIGNYPNSYEDSFPSSICTSVNDVVAHGMPDDKTVLHDGDIISIDCGVCLDGFNGVSCYTFSVGEITPEIRQLLQITKGALCLGIENAVAGKHVGDIGCAIQEHCEPYGFGIVRDLAGHGIGREMHEKPSVPNYGIKGKGTFLKTGMCLVIEPMVTLGAKSIYTMPDRWTIRTCDGKPTAHFGHTVAVCRGRVEILSSFDDLEQ